MNNILNNLKNIFMKFDNKKYNIFVAIFFILNFYLFTVQAFIPPGVPWSFFESDLPAHLNIITQQVQLDLVGTSSYSLFHIIAKILYLFKNDIVLKVGSGFILALFNVWTLLLLKKYFSKSLKEDNLWKINWFSFIAIIVTMIIIPFHKPFFGIGSPNQWQSPTYTVLRPFMLLSFMEFETLFLTKTNKKPYLFILWTVISMIAKPSFLMCFIPGSLLTVFFLNIKSFKNAVLESLKLFAYYLPALLIFGYQSFVVTSDSSTISFMLGGNWIEYAPYHCVPYAILIGNLFFLFVVFKNMKNMNASTICIIATFICAIAEALLFGETGMRSAHLNFLAPYFCAMFLSYLPVVRGCYLEKEYKTSLLLNIVLGLHIYSGFIYFLRFLIGLSYY